MSIPPLDPHSGLGLWPLIALLIWRGVQDWSQHPVPPAQPNTYDDADPGGFNR